MKEQLISFETAKLAKEKGFFIHTKYYYSSDNPLSDNIELKSRGWTIEESEGLVYTRIHEESGLLTYQIDLINNAPTQSLLQKWLWENFEIFIEIKILEGNDYASFYWNIFKRRDTGTGLFWITKDSNGIYEDTPEQALEKGLYQALKLIK